MDFTFTPEQRLIASTFRKLAVDLRTRASGDGRGDATGVEGRGDAAGIGGRGDAAGIGGRGDAVGTEGRGDAAGGRGAGAGIEGRSPAAEERWRRLVELGLAGVLAPESAGGVGLSDADFILVAEEAGRAALTEPLIEHAGIAVPMLAGLAGQTRADPEWDVPADPAAHALATHVLTRAASGAARVAIGHPINPYVLGGARADYLLLASGDEVHLVQARHARLTRVESIDRGRELVKVDLPAKQTTTRIAAGTAAREACRCALERGALYSAAQLVGLCQRMIDLAVAYARERRQFGKPIGSYQAIQHALASVQVKLEFARPVLYYAATRVCDPGLRAQAAVSHAKLAATDAADLAARTAIQVHGAMGYSWEVDLHVYMKRTWALAGAWGDRSFHARRVSSLVLEGRIELGPECTFD
jgi:alkylation response protein AidB-like acyl-CoA dehydrogenase